MGEIVANVGREILGNSRRFSPAGEIVAKHDAVLPKRTPHVQLESTWPRFHRKEIIDSGQKKEEQILSECFVKILESRISVIAKSGAKIVRRHLLTDTHPYWRMYTRHHKLDPKLGIF